MAYEMSDPFVLPDDAAKNQQRIKQYKAIIAVTFLAFLVTLILFVCAVLLGFGCSSNNKEGTKNASVASGLKFFHVSDIHLDLYYNSSTSQKSFCRSMPNTLHVIPVNAAFDAPYGRVRCDSPLKLVNSALTYMKKLSAEKQNNVEFILFTGDQVAHRVEKGFVNGTTLERVLNLMNSTSKAVGNMFSNIPFLLSLGNNDLPGDYNLPVDSKFFESVLKIWKPLILCDKCKLKVTTDEELQKTFLIGGYYKAEIKTSNMVFLQLNTNYWSKKSLAKNITDKIYATADGQMKWLEDQLKLCKDAGKKVITSGHIPPGIDAYGGTEFWAQNYTSKYIELVTKTYKDVVIGQLFGHIHKDDMKLQSANDQPKVTDKDLSFLLTAPGITPVYNNNPGFRIVTIDPDRKVIADYHQYYMDLVLTTQNKSPIWLFDYSFGEKYLSDTAVEQRNITGKSIAKLAGKMINATDGNRVWQTYIQHRQVNYQPDSYSRYALYCAMIHVTKANYDACLKSYPVTGG